MNVREFYAHALAQRGYQSDEAQLMATTDLLGGELLDPLKTTVVQHQRCMTTWVIRK